MRTAWVEAAWRTGNRALSLDMVGTYALPAFHGVKVCCTGLAVEERVYVEKTVPKLGGTYSPALDATCTHLVAAERSGRKCVCYQRSCPRILHGLL